MERMTIMKKVMKKIILAAIIVLTAITAVGCCSTESETENINTAVIEEAVKNALNEQKKTDARESTTYASTDSGTENINTAAIKEAVKDALDEQEREKKEKDSEFFTPVTIFYLITIIVLSIAIVIVAKFA